MVHYICKTKQKLGERASKQAAEVINNSIREKGVAHVILATGASQFETIESLTGIPNIDWSKVVMFHLDEYVGIPESHPASFRKYLKERFVAKVPKLKAAWFVEGDKDDPEKECERLNQIIADHPIDLALAGIGENGHLAFNDPPADFETEAPYIVVELDKACRMQQMGEGWFEKLEDVPNKAISMSVQQIMKSKNIICSVPDKRKAVAVKNCLSGDVSNQHPASILQKHPNCTIYLDPDSASLII